MVRDENVPDELLDALDELANQLLASEVFLRYQHAVSNFEADGDAVALLEELSRKQARIRTLHRTGGDPGEVEDLQSVQRRVREHPLVSDYLRTRQAASAYLGEINGEISELLGMDFARLAQRRTC